MNKIGTYRWRICALLFFATTINYLDRQVIGLLKPVLEDQFNWSESDYSNIVITFQAAYAISLLGFQNCRIQRYRTSPNDHATIGVLRPDLEGCR